jgi:hypothetical protein
MGMLIGVGVGYVAATTIGRPFGCGRGEMRVLTEDVDVELQYYVKGRPAPVKAVVRAGTEFEILARYGGRTYVSLQTILSERLVDRASKPHNE